MAPRSYPSYSALPLTLVYASLRTALPAKIENGYAVGLEFQRPLINSGEVPDVEEFAGVVGGGVGGLSPPPACTGIQRCSRL